MNYERRARELCAEHFPVLHKLLDRVWMEPYRDRSEVRMAFTGDFYMAVVVDPRAPKELNTEAIRYALATLNRAVLRKLRELSSERTES